MTEYDTHKAIVKWLSIAYPKARFHSDLSGVKLNMGTVAKMKQLNNWRGFPDLVIYEKCPGYCGLAIEIKKPGADPWKKKGGLKAGQHLKEQFEWLNHLKSCGFYACFATGFDEAKEIIEAYLEPEKDLRA